jgi:hypothetical protein
MPPRNTSESRSAPRQYSLVRFCFDQVPAEYHAKYPFKLDGVYVYFGDIPNMPGHCVVADHRTGQLYSGYHTENFVELAEDEA